MRCLTNCCVQESLKCYLNAHWYSSVSKLFVNVLCYLLKCIQIFYTHRFFWQYLATPEIVTKVREILIFVVVVVHIIRGFFGHWSYCFLKDFFFLSEMQN